MSRVSDLEKKVDALERNIVQDINHMSDIYLIPWHSKINMLYFIM